MGLRKTLIYSVVLNGTQRLHHLVLNSKLFYSINGMD